MKRSNFTAFLGILGLLLMVIGIIAIGFTTISVIISVGYDLIKTDLGFFAILWGAIKTGVSMIVGGIVALLAGLFLKIYGEGSI